MIPTLRELRGGASPSKFGGGQSRGEAQLKKTPCINQMIMTLLILCQGEPRHELLLRLPAPLLFPPVHSRHTLRQTARLLCLSSGGQTKTKTKTKTKSSGGQAPQALKSKSMSAGLERTRWRPACSFPGRGLQSRSGSRAGRGRVRPILQVAKPLDLLVLI